mgnify:CR=1 FL=1
MASEVGPIVLEPLLKHRVWGGRRLERYGKVLPVDETPIGESWEVADLPQAIEDGRNAIIDGPWKGMTLREAIARDREAILGDAELTPDGGFPLLIKYLDAQENLSVQVHPTAAFVKRHPEAHLKSEAWYVLEAEPGAVIYKGVKPGVEPAQFREHIAENTVVDDLVAVPVEAGDCHYLPSGTCHALGAGVVVAEVQTPSDTTFRVYDWGRTGRELHVDEALACIDFSDEPTAEAGPDMPMTVGGLRSQRLVRTEYFSIERVEALEQGAVLHAVTQRQPVVWMFAEGRGRLEWPGGLLDMGRGRTALLPAALDGRAEATLEAGATVLVVQLPSRIDHMIA